MSNFKIVYHPSSEKENGSLKFVDKDYTVTNIKENRFPDITFTAPCNGS